MRNIRIRLDRLLDVLGAPGIVGIGLMLFSLGLCFLWIVPVRGEVAAMQQKTAAQHGLPQVQSTKNRQQEPLSEFYEFFPPLASGPDWLKKVYALAEKEGLEVPKAEYRLIMNAQDKLTSYQAVFPLKGTYAQVRGFIVNVLNELPFASLDDLRLEKQRTADTAVETQVKLTIFLRVQ